jgi:purine-binding chemotaxis protein CheW
MRTLVVFSLDERQIALAVDTVERVVRVVEITPLPKAPAIVVGVTNFQGRIIPVLNIRSRFQLPQRALQLSDHLIIATAGERVVALLVDNVTGVVEAAPENISKSEEIFRDIAYVEGVVPSDGKIVVIHDLESFLSAAESAKLEAALAE